MRDLLRRGIASVVDEGSADFVRALEERGLPPSELSSARAALEDMVDLLAAFNRATSDEHVPLAARVLFPAVASYFFTEDDLLPSRRGQLVLGLLDDAWLVFRAGLELSGPLGVSADGARRHLAFLERILPADVRQRLDAVVAATLATATSHAEHLGL